jgi:hypothetical protein
MNYKPRTQAISHRAPSNLLTYIPNPLQGLIALIPLHLGHFESKASQEIFMAPLRISPPALSSRVLFYLEVGQ